MGATGLCSSDPLNAKLEVKDEQMVHAFLGSVSGSVCLEL